jgi:hypothetical protein
MAYKVTFVLETLKGGASDMPARRTRRHLLEGLTECAVHYLRAHPEVPPLRSLGMRVFDEYANEAEWGDVPTLLLRGVGSKDALACWAAGEARVRGGKPNAIAAVPFRPMPHRVIFVLNCLRTAHDRALVADQCIQSCLKALTLHDIDWLRLHPETPSIYTSGVRYEEEPPGQDDWADIAECLRLRKGDCEDFGCWRAAELRVKHRIAAGPVSTRRNRPRGGLLYHIQTKYPDGRVEDPSRRLGMR